MKKIIRKVALVVGARPNFMKSAPLLREFEKHSDKFETFLIHTGQHYNYELSELFFTQLKIKQPDIYLQVGSDSHARQTANIMIKLEEVFIENKPDLVVVFGDVNSTLAASIVAAKLNIDIAHVEAGLRSFDNEMPEEINRIITDRLSRYLFVTEESGVTNLINEGIPEDKIFFTGNIMIDSLTDNFDRAGQSDILTKLSLTRKEYATLTLHRPSNVDDKTSLKTILSILAEISKIIPIIFPCHPRTQMKLKEFEITSDLNDNRVRIIDPVGYLDFLKLQSESKFVLTDSGGIQEETTYLGIPCITLRENTERPVTVDIGTNIITGTDKSSIVNTVNSIIDGNYKKGEKPYLWDGKTAQRIIDILLRH